MFFKIDVIKNFSIFTGKHLCWSLFLVQLQAKACNFTKKRLQHRRFPVNIEKFLRTAFHRTPSVAASINILYCVIAFRLKQTSWTRRWPYRNIYRPKKLSYYCNTKDKVPEYLKSHIVYVNFVAQPVIVNILEKQIEILAPVFKSRVVRTKVTGLQSFAGMWTYQLCGKLA